MTYDPDLPNPAYVRQLEDLLSTSMKRIQDLILNPKGGSPASIQWNINRYQSTYMQVAEQLRKLGHRVADWTGKAISTSAAAGWRQGTDQLSYVVPPSVVPPSGGNFNVVNFDVIHTLARDTHLDIQKALSSTEKQIRGALVKMADNGLTAGEVNKLLATGEITGRPRESYRGLRDALQSIHGDTLTIPTARGTMEYKTKDYAGMVARTRMRQAHVIARHERLQRDGVDYVVIIGNVTQYPCTAYLGKIFYIGSGADPEGRFPNLETLTNARGYAAPPFHPNCSKSTAPIVIELASKAALRMGEPDSASEDMADAGVSSSQGRKIMDSGTVETRAENRMADLAADIRERARANGMDVPPWAPNGGN